MQKSSTKKQIISYRRRCKLIGQGTGLSHYILLSPKADEPVEAAAK